MSIQLENVKYRMPNGEYYVATSNLDKEGKGFLFQDEYFMSKGFSRDFIKTLIDTYPNILTDYILENGELSVNLECFNNILSNINAELIFSSMNEDTSRLYIDKEKLAKYYDSGVFEELNRCYYTKIIYVVGT